MASPLQDRMCDGGHSDLACIDRSRGAAARRQRSRFELPPTVQPAMRTAYAPDNASGSAESLPPDLRQVVTTGTMGLLVGDVQAAVERKPGS